MADPNLADFNGRVKRIRRAHQKGGGFEATGTLGRSAFNRNHKSGMPLVGPLLIVLMAVFGLKSLIYAKIGAGAYQARVTELSAGKGIDPLGAFIMQADPVTVALAAKVAPFLH